jgi:uncharacterized protein (TIGR02594 family)
MLSRRELLADSLVACAVVGNVRNLAAAKESPGSTTQDDFEGALPRLVDLGTKPATSEEVTTGLEIVARAPSGRAPFEAMEYFERLTRRNEDGWLYNGGWPNRWNPVIVAFFEATNQKPVGDVTPWCAAFLNWCLARSGLYRGTRDAGSLSFRGHGTGTTQPQMGDIAVFVNTKPGFESLGHVGIFIEARGDKCLVLGGNQVVGVRHHVVSRQWIDKAGNYEESKGQTVLRLHSYRSLASLRL